MSMSSQDLGQHQRNIFTVICLDLLCKVQVSDFKIEMTSTTWRKLYKQGSLTTHINFGSKKTTGFGSNMEARSKPFASEGLDGITTWCRNEQMLLSTWALVSEGKYTSREAIGNAEPGNLTQQNQNIGTKEVPLGLVRGRRMPQGIGCGCENVKMSVPCISSSMNTNYHNVREAALKHKCT